MLVKHIFCDCKCKFDSSTCNYNRKWNNHKRQCDHKKYPACKKDYNWNPSIYTCENNRYLKSIANTSVIACNEIINATDCASTNVTSIISTNVTSTMLTNSDDKKVRYKMDSYILLPVLIVIILIFIIRVNCYHYAKHRSKLKNIFSC